MKGERIYTISFRFGMLLQMIFLLGSFYYLDEMLIAMLFNAVAVFLIYPFLILFVSNRFGFIESAYGPHQ